MEEPITIPLSKKKMLLLLLGAVFFIAAGIAFVLYPDTFRTPLFSNIVIIRIAGVASVLFFGICLLVSIRKLQDTQDGLVIDAHGITDNSNATSVGLIRWEDIVGIRTVSVFTEQFILIDVQNPEQYVERGSNFLLRKALQANLNQYGSPVSIVANSLKCDVHYLQSLLVSEFERRKV